MHKNAVIFCLLMSVNLASCKTNVVVPEDLRRDPPPSAVTPPETNDFLTPFNNMWLELSKDLLNLKETLYNSLSPPTSKPKPSDGAKDTSPSQ